jgi:hypothetical protein
LGDPSGFQAIIASPIGAGKPRRPKASTIDQVPRGSGLSLRLRLEPARTCNAERTKAARPTGRWIPDNGDLSAHFAEPGRYQPPYLAGQVGDRNAGRLERLALGRVVATAT